MISFSFDAFLHMVCWFVIDSEELFLEFTVSIVSDESIGVIVKRLRSSCNLFKMLSFTNFGLLADVF